MNQTSPSESGLNQALAQARPGRLDLVLYCAGHYNEMRATGFDLADMNRHMAINYTGALNLLDALLPGALPLLPLTDCPVRPCATTSALV